MAWAAGARDEADSGGDEAVGVALFRAAVAPVEAARWLRLIGAAAASAPLAYVEGLDLGEVLRGVVQGALRAHCERLLLARHDGPLACAIDHCWVRRQFAPATAAARRAAHFWHQDGALKARFDAPSATARPADTEPLHMLTCWLALTPCGRHAPGLQWVEQRLPKLLAPAELADARVQARFAAGLFRQPELGPGDALLLPGDTLHRTHVTPAMTGDRSSLELRLFAAGALPERLAGARFVSLG